MVLQVVPRQLLREAVAMRALSVLEGMLWAILCEAYSMRSLRRRRVLLLLRGEADAANSVYVQPIVQVRPGMRAALRSVGRDASRGTKNAVRQMVRLVCVERGSRPGILFGFAVDRRLRLFRTAYDSALREPSNHGIKNGREEHAESRDAQHTAKYGDA